MVDSFAKKKRALEVAEREYHKAIEIQRKKLLDERADIDSQLAELDALTGTQPRPSGKRRTGIRNDVWALVKAKGPMTRAKVLETMKAKGDKSLTGSISNALASLKKSGALTLKNRNYKAKK